MKRTGMSRYIFHVWLSHQSEDDLYNCITKNIDKIKKLEERISKAIKMLEEDQKDLEEWHFDGYDPNLKEVIEILKGEDHD